MSTMSNMNNTYFGKTSKFNNKSKTQNIAAGLRNEVIDPDVFYTRCNENISLKKQIQELELENKRLSAKSQHLLGENKKLNMKLNKDPQYIKEENSKQEYSKDNQTLKIENENLKNKNKRLNETVNVMQKKLGKMKSKGLGVPSRVMGGQRYPNAYQINDYEQLIRHLQNSLKSAHEDRRNLINEITSMREGGLSKAKIEFSDNIRDKNLKISELSLELDRIKTAFETNQKLLNLTKTSLDEYIEKYEIERNKKNQLETELQSQQSALEKLDEYTTMIENYKKKEKMMEEKITELCESPFIKQINERDKNFVKLREAQTALSEAQRLLQIENEKTNELKKKYNELNENYNKIKQERDQFREDGMRYKIAKEEREKQGKEIDEVLNKISQSGEVDSNLQKFTNLLHGQLAKDAKGNNWENIDFLEKMDKFPDSKEELKKEIERLIMEKSRLGKELANTQYNYAILQQINEDLKKKQEIEKKLYMKQINSLRKIAELVDRRNIPSDYDLNVLYNKDIKPKEREEEKNIGDINEYNKELINRSVYTSITGFSVDSSEDGMSIDENYLDLYITAANFDIDGIQNKLGIEIDNLMSFISVDFYLHETQTSNLMSGQRPNYNFQLSFKVNEDENFISYLQDEYIIIELYYLKDNTQTIFANGKIKLSQLIQIETDPKTRVIHGYVEMFYIDDSSIKLCDIKYKMRMRKSILEKIKWINEKNMLYNELDPVNEANMKIMSELNLHRPTMNMSLYQKDDINNKVYNIKIKITKGEQLKSNGENMNILPYLYYSFYKQNEHYSNIIPGTEPVFNDIEEYTCVYTKNFHNYLDKETLDVYVFDSSSPIEVDTDGKEVEMVRKNIENDLIGICKVKLRGLILNNKIEGKFEILNEKGDKNMGYLILNIVAEEIALETNEKKLTNDLDTNLVQDIDPLLDKLARILRQKGLKMNSAFSIFDTDGENQISIENFRSIALFTLKLDQKDLDKLIPIVFGNKVVLDQQDFYQLFNNLLPMDDETEYKKTKVLGQQTQISFDIIDKQNTTNNINNIKINNTTGDLNQIDVEASNNTMNNKLYATNYNNINNNINIYNVNKNKYVKKNSKTMNEIILKIEDYMFHFGKKTASDLFKIFDHDANLKVGKKELADGFAKMGIQLNPEEHQMVWRNIVGKGDKESFGIEEFNEFYRKNKVKK